MNLLLQIWTVQGTKMTPIPAKSGFLASRKKCPPFFSQQMCCSKACKQAGGESDWHAKWIFFFNVKGNLLMENVVCWIGPPLQIHILKSWPSVPQNVTTFGDGVFKEVIRLTWGHWGGALIQCDWGPYKNVQSEDTGRRQPSTSRGERTQEKLILLTPWSQTSNPGIVRKSFFCYLSHPVYSTLLWQL